MNFPLYRYTEHDKVNLIEIKIRRINQLFNSLDPSPFLEKDLDDDAFEYILSSVSEHSIRRKHRIIIHLPINQKKSISEHEIKKAVKNFFEYKKTIAEKNIRMKIGEGQLSFVVGIVFLAFCLFTSNYISANFHTLVSNILVEGLIIGGWVAMWKPISNLLYDWWPLQKERNIFEKISKMDIEFRYVDYS
jgi:hypothetical protein